MREELQDNVRRLMNFMAFARSFFKRNNPFKALIISLVSSLKEMLTIRQKLKMAKYRVNYHKHQLYKMENLIAESNEHTFLKGKNLNETR
ncbi:hypothetical protein J6R97_03240 [bacterium]|jgi:hypothetical protein|nr:hypothetical protein [bacterium]